jgi:hypothetical protein
LTLIEEGNVDGALESCDNMRLSPDLGWLGHTERAIVNLLIIKLNDPEGFDSTKFAEEALKLVEDKQGDYLGIFAHMEEQASQLILEFRIKKIKKSAETASATPHAKGSAQSAKAGQGDDVDKDGDKDLWKTSAMGH